MKALNVRHLPVVNGAGKLVGIVSDRDFQRVMNRERVSEADESYTFDGCETVEDIMSWPVKAISAGTTIRAAASQMLQEKLSALVIASADQHPVGIVTTDDFLRYLLDSDDRAFERPIYSGTELRVR